MYAVIAPRYFDSFLIIILKSVSMKSASTLSPTYVNGSLSAMYPLELPARFGRASWRISGDVPYFLENWFRDILVKPLGRPFTLTLSSFIIIYRSLRVNPESSIANILSSWFDACALVLKYLVAVLDIASSVVLIHAVSSPLMTSYVLLLTLSCLIARKFLIYFSRTSFSSDVTRKTTLLSGNKTAAPSLA